ncbi:dihydrolipoyl dehydrogenase [Chromatiales bacterium (ex Bugula neritina AB1)]|nr:dihydrolipoyl dehydrogenase [Chromatiales bacterium (ex Bugula neritina AB1)]
MTNLTTIEVPNIGDFKDVEIIELLVAVGDTVAHDQSLITVESDKASMEIPSPEAGEITSVLVKVGDRISTGSAIVVIDAAEAPTVSEPANTPPQNAPAKMVTTTTTAGDNSGVDVVVIGAGPGGYTAAFRAADLGLSVLLIERYPDLGGVCLNVGCIPSKALLHTAQIINETREMAAHGIDFGEPEIDINKLRGFKEGVISRLTGGLKGLARQRDVTVAHGVANFISPTELTLDGENPQTIKFKHAIIAAGSEVTKIPGFPYDDPRLIDSTGALKLDDIPSRMLVIGGGIIGLEMSCVYQALGTKVTVVELSDTLIPGCDRDLVRPFQKRVGKLFENIFTGSRVTKMEPDDIGLKVWFEGGAAPEQDTFDRVLLAVGRSPNGGTLSADKAGVHVDDRGFIPVDKQQKTNVDHIFAIGDVVGQPMLAHKATREGKIAAEVIAGQKSYFDARTIPSVAYTDPEIAWMGLTETQAKAENIPYETGVFPWAASGRALSMARSEGLTKVLLDPETKQVLGAGMVGVNAGELIGEAVLALEMGADIEDIALTVHPHPTLSETLNFACEVAEGTCTDIYAPKS